MISVLPVLAQTGIPASGAAQIQALMQEKASRTPAQRKLDSQIHYSAKGARGQMVAAGIPSLPSIQSGVDLANGLIHVDIQASVNPDLLAAIAGMGGRVESSFPQYNTIRAWVPVLGAETIAQRADVRFIRPAEKSHTNGRVRAARLRTELETILPRFNGPADLTGVKAHGADVAQGTGVMGAGVKIGVLSDGVTTLAAEQAAGRLPAVVTVIPNQGGQGPGPCPVVPPPDQTGRCPDEGTAMLEIIHAMAPNAQLFFATANPTQAQFATNILALRAAGCDIIVDDVGYFAEPVFQDGIVANAVNAVTAAGAIYLSAAGNGGHLDNNESGTWEGDYVAGANFPQDPGVAHNFGPTSYDVLTAPYSNEVFLLQWSDPFGASCNDYDLFVLDASGSTVLGASTNTQDCTQDPFEALQGTAPLNARIVIVNFGMAHARALHLDTSGGLLSISTSGNVYGHSAAASAVSVAAVAAGSALGGQFTGGIANPAEFFSSDGPRKIFYDPNGIPITPGNFLFGTNGGITLDKVDLAAADGVGTGAAGFSSFFGTSAAAPHAAAIAALVKSANPTLTNTQIKNAMLSTALAVSNIQSRTVGAGIIMANRAVAAVQTPALSITKTHSGTFTQGQTGATYTVTVSNGVGAAPTSGIVTVTESVPAGEILVSMAGTGWTCPGTAPNNCTRSDALLGGVSYMPITVTVNVAGNASSPQLNVVGVLGGGSPAASSMDSTVIIPSATTPILGITKTHTGNFTLGQNGVYTVTVTNAVGAGPSIGTVTVTDTVPASAETLVSMAGTGWTCPGTAANNCTRSDALSGGASYPPITVTVGVAAQAASPQINAVSVSGGGSATTNAIDPTAFEPLQTALLHIAKAHSGNFTQGQTGVYTVTVSNAAGAAPTTGTVTVTDVLPPGETLVSMAGTGWTCPGTLANNCTRSNSLAGDASYPPITVTVNVAGNATSPQVNVAGVTGGGSVAANALDSTIINTLSPVLSITKTHSGNFTTGQMGVYTVTVSNTAGAGTTRGIVTVTDTVPTAETLVSMVGTGWTCPGTSANNCTRSDALAAGASYPPITATVSVAAGAASPQVNAVSVSGGGSVTANAMDSTVVTPAVVPALLGIAKTHTGNFTLGQTGTYTVIVSDATAAGPTVGPVTVADTVPAGLTLVSMAGTGWACPGTAANNCTRNDVLTAGQSYPPITVVVTVAGNALPSLTNSATVTGGGSPSATAMDATTIIPSPLPTIILTPIALTPGDTSVLPVSLSVPSSNTVFVTLTSSDPSIVSLSTAFTSATGAVLVPADSTMSTGLRVVAGKAGSATITARATGYLPATVVVVVGSAVVPPTIAATGGTPQSASVNTAFASPLMARVTMGGNPVVGTPVTFTAPATGPSGSFAGGGATATVMTNAAGVAISPTLMANSAAGSYAVIASAPGVASPASFLLTNVGAGAMILLTPITLHLGDTLTLPVSLSSPATDSVFVTLTSSDPSVVSLSTATVAATGNVLIQAGESTSTRLRVAAGKAGTVTITATATGYPPAILQLVVTP